MKKTSARHIFFLALFTIFTFTGAFAQTITVGNVDPGPYGQGSNIAVPITINDAAACINQGNTFNLYLSDASGNFPAGGTLIGTSTGFYSSFLNGVIPAGTPAGGGYKVIVKSTNPVVTSAASAAFTINAGTAVTAGVSSQIIGIKYPEVFGQCSGSDGSKFTFTDNSSTGATTTATFLNEQTHAAEASNVAITTAGYAFTANAANYTVIVKAKTATGAVGTHAYLLLNNVINTAIGSTGSQTVCLINGKGDLTINIDISSPTGIQFNYPGNLYSFSWGDGSAPTILSFCEIKALNGQVTHTFTKASCGNAIGLQVNNVYCGNIGAPPTSQASVIVPPKNIFVLKPTACAGTPVTINNTSDPGLDAKTCLQNTNALYTWLLDGVAYQNYPLNKPFVIPATTLPGTHTVTLQLQNGSPGCLPTDVSHDICLQAPPKPIFSIPATACMSSGPLTPVNTSVVDAGCSSTNQYVWTVTGPAPVTYASGTNANSKSPQFTFTAPGAYSIQLAITTPNCGSVSAPAQNIVVDGTPTASLSPDATLCGNNQTLIFDPNPGPTQTKLTGTAQALPTTYTWVITGGAFSFQNTTTQNSQYPIIAFADFATYTIKVTQVNTCGTITKTQKLTFVQAPTVTAGSPQTICASTPVVTLAGQITGTTTNYQWTGGNGTFAPDRKTLTAKYTPSAAEINAGQVTLTLQATTALPAPCNIINSNVTISITPIANITSPPSKTICTGEPVAYDITSNDPTSSFT